MTPSGFIYLFGLAVIANLVIYIVKRFSGPPFVVRRWASDHGYRIVESRFRKCGFRGSYELYYVRVRDFHGIERSGLLHCYSAWGTDKTEVEWNDEHATSSV